MQFRTNKPIWGYFTFNFNTSLCVQTPTLHYIHVQIQYKVAANVSLCLKVVFNLDLEGGTKTSPHLQLTLSAAKD